MFRPKLWTARNLGWAISEDTFVAFDGKILKDFKHAVEYQYKPRPAMMCLCGGHAWEAPVPKPPERGWEAEKDRICSVDQCWTKLETDFVCCTKCPRGYHLRIHCIHVDLDVSKMIDTFECALLSSDSPCTQRLEPILK